MHRYYKDAYVTISAIAAARGNEGFLLDRPVSQGIKLDQENLYLRLPRASWNDVMSASPIFKRAWTLQEQDLSTRILHFGRQELVWECQTCSLRESDAKERKYSAGVTVGGLFWHTFKPILADTERLRLHPQEAITRWLNVLNEYSSRSLTKAEDKLPAIAGLAQVIQQATGYTYLAGCWQEDLRRTLLWSRDFDDSESVPSTSSSADAKPYRAPSWSFASFDEPVRHEMYFPEHSYPPAKLDMHFVSGSTTTVGQNGLGQVTGGSITLRAWSMSARFTPRTDKFQRRHDIYAHLQLSVAKDKINWRLRRSKQVDMKLAYAVLDNRADGAVAGDCTLIRITEQDYGAVGLSGIVIYCLMIVPDHRDRSKWRRIGLANIDTKDLKTELMSHKRAYDFEDWKWREFEIV